MNRPGVALAAALLLSATGCVSLRSEEAGSETVKAVEPVHPAAARITAPHSDYVPRPNERAERAPEQELTQIPEHTVYRQVRKFAGYVHELIAEGAYSTWKELLTDSYVERYGDGKYLAELSQKPVLRNQGITLETLKDYFDHVVVKSRTETEVESVEVIDSNQALAYTTVEGKAVVIMLAVAEDGYWKIGRY